MKTRWKLVPVEPTPEMIDAWNNDDSGEFRHAYRAMLESAPTPAEAPADVASDAEYWKLLLKNLVDALNETHWSSWQSTDRFDGYLQEAFFAIERELLGE